MMNKFKFCKLFSLLFIFLIASCVSTTKSVFLETNLSNEDGKQVLFFTQKPSMDYQEIVILEFDAIPKKSNLVFNKFKDLIEKYKLDAVIEIKSETYFKNFGLPVVKYSGMGIRYK